MNKAMIKVENVWKRYAADKPWVLKGLSLEAGEKEAILILGSNGSGKTTLIRLLSGLDIPNKGRVLVKGIPVKLRESRRAIGVVLHHSLLYNNLTLKENLEFYAQLYGRKEYEPGNDPVIEILGLKKHLNTRVSDLSFGWRRRSDIARALVHKPEILLIDEPFTGLDKKGIEELTGVLTEFVYKGGLIIATSPIEVSVSQLDFKLMKLSEGVLIERGN